VPHDQCRTFRAVWDGPSLKFALVLDARPEPEEAERIRLMSKTGEQLQVAAAKARVEWDKDASRETMVERIILAAKAAEHPLCPACNRDGLGKAADGWFCNKCGKSFSLQFSFPQTDTTVEVK
jgi:ribosomal protein L37AE/L43A